MKLTKWIPGNVKPVRVGVYERANSRGSTLYSHWNGSFWGTSAFTPERAAWQSARLSPSVGQNLPWRGLAEKP